MNKSATTLISSLHKSEPLFVDILFKRAEQNSHQKAFTFLTNEGDKVLTYSELDLKVRRLAAYLQQKNLRGERALLLYPPGFNYIVGYFACLYAGIIAVPVYPPDPSRMDKTLPRLEAVAKDAEAKIALSTDSIIEEVNGWKESIKETDSKLGGKTNPNGFLEKFKDLLNIDWLATDSYSEEIEDLWVYPNISSNDIAYLQYTSGSTGVPKGVMITHSNLIHNTQMIFSGFQLDRSEHEGVIWLPIYHDMGLVGGILEPISAGFHCNLLSPIDFLKRPAKWLQIISDLQDRDIVSGGPNFAYELCIRATNDRKRKELNLSNWKVAFTGAEPVRAETINEFSTAFEVSGFSKKAFFPCFGLAEGTLIVSGSSPIEDPVEISIKKEELKKNKIVKSDVPEDSIKIVSSGTRILDSVLRVVNPDTKEICPDFVVGEVWTLSKSNAKGYWEKPELSKEVFDAYTSDKNEGPFLRTGDLGFMIKGELFITGRLKDLIIIRGSNHYPQDIELTVENSNKLLRPGSVAAFSADFDNEEKLVIVQEARAKPNVDWGRVIADIKNLVLLEHNISPHEIVLIKPKTIFKTSSGKIQRGFTKDAYLDNSLEIIFKSDPESNFLPEKNEAPVNINSKELILEPEHSNGNLTKILVEKLAIALKVDPLSIDKDSPFTNYGLDSAKSLQLVGELEEVIGKSLDATILWNYPSVNKLASYLSHGKNDDISTNSGDGKTLQEEISMEEFAAKVEELSEEEAEELLLKKLNNN